MILGNDVLICGGVAANKQPLKTCDNLKDKSAWEFDKIELKRDMTFSAAAPSPFKDWYVTGGYEGKYLLTYSALQKTLFFPLYEVK